MIVAHLDLDAFFAAVEELEDPALARVPLVVGGDPHGRGVVATANYLARRSGIRSAMSCAEALRRCPQAVFVRPRHRVYAEYSKAVWLAVREVCPTVERTGLDEGYLDVEEVAGEFRRARAVAEAVQAAVRAATRLSCSLGVATCKVVAKVASDRRKPGGLTVVPPGREAAFLEPFAIRLLPGVGPRSEARLTEAGVTTIGSLASLGDDELAAHPPGQSRDRAAQSRMRHRSSAARARGGVDLDLDRGDLRAGRHRPRGTARRAAPNGAARSGRAWHRDGLSARTVTTKVRYPDFAIRSRSQTLPVGIDDAERIAELACALLDRALADRPGALRLVGVGVSNLEPYRQLVLA